jgi:hypothetical protein
MESGEVTLGAKGEEEQAGHQILAAVATRTRTMESRAAIDTRRMGS